ncbi:MAG: M1 family aminopeptidase [Candidatus Neomarinimicrobiota bacterium]
MRIFLIISFSLLFASDDKAPINRTRDRQVDIHHIKIDVNVDLVSESVYGYVVHKLSPLNSSLSSFELDAEDMTIRRVRLNDRDVNFDHSGGKLHVSLENNMGWTDTVKVRIDYTAFPLLGTFFIKPDDTYPEKPWQAWTQGEENDNHHWVPIYDYPNDRSTFEISLTVDNKFKAISNGELKSVKQNDDGTHTWHWHEHYPMVSYLMSFVVGDYVKVEDSYGNLPVNYWVYEENKNETMRSFGLTTDMMGYFEDFTGVKYPYEKYDQIILDDFMFGGMENITLTHNTDRTMHDQFSVPDVSSVGLVAHELAHQWYGDMLTTRNWANIWLNEGFATFLSRKYREKKFGYDEGEYIRYGEILSYFGSNARWNRPTVHDNYYEPIDLFDGHVYAKGSLILNMMNDYLKGDAFMRSVQHYTISNKFKNVETQDLKKSIEEVTGQNLDWFFRQWVYEPGYPEYHVKWSYNQRNRTVKLKVEQKQDSTKTGLFSMPINVMIDNQNHVIWIDQKDMVYEVPVEKRPKMVIFNSGMRVPCKVEFNKPISEWIMQLEEGPHILDRIAAVNVLKKKKGRRNIENALLKAIETDSFWGVRKEAVRGLASLKPKQYSEDLMRISEGQDNRVRRAIWSALKNYKNDSDVSLFLQNIIFSDPKYYSVSDAFKALVVVDTAAARKNVDNLLSINSHSDVIRKAAISYFGIVKNNQNYDRLKKLASYGGTTWDARPEAVLQLSKYVKGHKKEILELYVDFLDDKSRDVRRRAVQAIGRHGGVEHLGNLDEALSLDPVIGRDVRTAKKRILNPKKKKSISDLEKELQEANDRLDDIKKILD